MQETENLKLKKPDLNNYVNIGDLNENADLIDAAVTKNKEDLAAHLADDAAHGIGDKATLLTTQKSTIVSAVNELFTNVSNGKSLVGGAITDVDENIVIPTEPTFQDLATAIGNISTGKKWASGVSDTLGTETFQYAGSGSTNASSIEVNGLDFEPSFIIFASTSNDAIATYRNNGVNYPKISTGHGSVSTTSSTVVRSFKADVLPAYINSTGFRIPVYAAGTYNWIAFE